MKIKQGKIENINKKIIAGALTFTLVALPLMGCDSITIESIKNTEVSGEVVKTNVNIDSLAYCFFAEVYNRKNDERYYTIVFEDVWNGGYLIKRYDLFTEEKLIPENFVIKSMVNVKKYLAEENLIKNQYSEEELKDILNEFVLKQENTKRLIKE